MQVAAPAKAGAQAPLDVIVTARNTGLGPEKTSFFQALSIPTKISRGTIEILVSFMKDAYLWKSHCECSVANLHVLTRDTTKDND